MQRFHIASAFCKPGANASVNFKKMLAMNVPLADLRERVFQKVVSTLGYGLEVNGETVLHKIFDNFQVDAITEGRRVSSY